MLCDDVQADLKARGINEQVNLEMVGGSSKTAIVLNLITYLERRGHLGSWKLQRAGRDRTRSSDRERSDSYHRGTRGHGERSTDFSGLRPGLRVSVVK